MTRDTVAALATAPGTGGIAVVRISGPQAYAVAAQVFAPADKARKVEEAKGYTAMYGRFLWRGRPQDETVALFFRAPKSYTGEDVVELSCHGGAAVTKALLEACIEAGAVPAPPGEFTKRAFLSGRISLTQAEAVMDLISASSRSGAAAAQAALSGALYQKIKPVTVQLTALAGHIAAYIDYPEEGVPGLEEGVLRDTLCRARETLRALIEGYDKGAMLRMGVETAIVGSPNVGKSTLFNLLAGFDRAIVTPIAGTTRDVVEQAVQVGGLELLLADTAGLRETADTVEAEGIRRSYGCFEKAQLVVAVFDGSQPLEEAGRALCESCRGRRALAVVNKTDLERRLKAEDLAGYFTDVIELSARDEDAADKLEKAVAGVLQLAGAEPGGAMLANARQLSAAVKAAGALDDALEAERQGFDLDAVGVCIDDALNALYELTGESASDAVIEEVFSKFCVGK